MFADLQKLSEPDKECPTCGRPAIDARIKCGDLVILQCQAGHQWKLLLREHAVK